MTQRSESSRGSEEGIALAAAGDVGRSMATLFTQTIQRYQDTFRDENLEFGDFILLHFLASTANWREGLVEFLLNVTGDNPQRVVGRALEHGRLVAGPWSMVGSLPIPTVGSTPPNESTS